MSQIGKFDPLVNCMSETGQTDTVSHSLDNTDTGGGLSFSHSSDPGAGLTVSVSDSLDTTKFYVKVFRTSLFPNQGFH